MVSRHYRETTHAIVGTGLAPVRACLAITVAIVSLADRGKPCPYASTGGQGPALYLRKSIQKEEKSSYGYYKCIQQPLPPRWANNPASGSFAQPRSERCIGTCSLVSSGCSGQVCLNGWSENACSS